MSKSLDLERRGPVLIAWMNRPPVNALNRDFVVDLNEAMDVATGNQGAQVLVLASRLKAFCGGADLKMMLDMNRLTVVEWASLLQRTFDRLEQLPIPTIAAVQGPAIGGGCELSLACDLRIMAPGAFMALPEVKRGLLPGGGGTQRLARMVGYGRALEIMLTGNNVLAEDALRMGLANRLDTDPVEAAVRLGEELAAVSGPAINEIKQCLLTGIVHGYRAGSFAEASAAQRLVDTPEFREMVKAFLERKSGNPA